MSQKILGVIPARYASTRFPGKPLIKLGNKTMIQRVYEQASTSKSLLKVVVATDNEEIFQHVVSFGGAAVKTKEEHPSGTDRCFEAFEKLQEPFDYVINVQGDEPFIQPAQIDLLASLCDGKTHIATLVKQIKDTETVFNPNVVKAIINKQQQALYFSRSAIPFQRGVEVNEWISKGVFYKHIGMYAYKSEVLKQITKLAVSELEKAESLEQLRWLDNGFEIKAAITELETIGIDVPEDVEKIKHLL
ncbi:MAG: 3-deoxy-manno-octulosonate cytidylyltransferase [Cyclobacteriaceae bacterium]|jgi:3-deoxy-manno-octulosonate cytidylyltransferase (CMP-KDO synthetase)|nr:3-deoxy-manno-octulosonate cytidylyltransferase [Cyclobacteriaceae bacterium]